MKTRGIRLTGMVLAAALGVAVGCSDDPGEDAGVDGGRSPGDAGGDGAVTGDAAGSDAGGDAAVDADAGPPPDTGRFVIAHWMIRMGRRDANMRAQSDYEEVLGELRDYGVDALVVYWDSYEMAVEQYATALDAAEAVGMKIAWGFLGMQGESFREMVVAQKDREGLFRDPEGRIVLTGFFTTWGMSNASGSWELDAAGNTRLDELTSGGVDVAYWPDLPSPRSRRCEDAAAVGAVGLSEFFYGGVFDHEDWLASADARLGQCDAAGVPYMPPILPFYAAQVTHNWQMFESYAYVGLREQWMWAIDHDVPAVQLITVNDYNEDTYVQTFGNGGPIVGTPDNPWWGRVLVLDHSGFGKFMRRYADWYRTGVEPPITEDQFLIAYRLHPRTAVSYGDLSAPARAALEPWLPEDPRPGYVPDEIRRIETHDVMDDSVQLVARLAAPADVTLEVGDTSVTESLPAGEHILVVEGAELSGDVHTFTEAQYGFPHVTVRRGDATVLDRDAELEITGYIVPGNYNYYAAELE